MFINYKYNNKTVLESIGCIYDYMQCSFILYNDIKTQAFGKAILYKHSDSIKIEVPFINVDVSNKRIDITKDFNNTYSLKLFNFINCKHEYSYIDFTCVKVENDISITSILWEYPYIEAEIIPLHLINKPIYTIYNLKY